MWRLPNEIQRRIYRFDPTYHTFQHRRVLQQLINPPPLPELDRTLNDLAFTIFITFGMAMLTPFAICLWLYDLLERKIDSFRIH